MRRVVVAGLLGAAALLAGVGARVDAAPETYELIVVTKLREGDPVASAQITVQGPLSAPEFHQARLGDERGRAVFRLPRTGTYSVEVFKEKYRSFSSNAEIKDAFGLTFVAILRSMTVYGVDVDVTAAGRPVAAAAVTLRFDDAHAVGVLAKEYTATSDAAGKARFNLPDAGTWVVLVRHPEQDRYEGVVSVADAAIRVPMRVDLAAIPKGALRRIVVTIREEATDAPIAGAVVTLEGEEWAENAVSNLAGRATFRPWKAGTYEVHVVHASFVPEAPKRVVVKEGAGDDLAVTFACVAIEVDHDGRGGAVGRGGPLVEIPPPGEDLPGEVVPKVPDVTVPKRPEIDLPKPPTPPIPPMPPDVTVPKPPDVTVPKTPDVTVPPADFAGRWRHTSGKAIVLTQTGATVTGTWEHVDSQLTGTVRGNVFTFQTKSAGGLECTGEVALDAGGRTFFGTALVTQSATDRGRRFHFDAERVAGR